MKLLQIRQCGHADVEALRTIGERTFRETFGALNSEDDMERYISGTFSAERLEDEVGNKNSIFFLLEQDGLPAAYMKVNFDAAQTEKGFSNSIEIQRIYVLDGLKGKGIGRLLVQKAVELGRSMKLDFVWLGVWEENIDAQRFYEKIGFKITGEHIFQLGKARQKDYLMTLEL